MHVITMPKVCFSITILLDMETWWLTQLNRQLICFIYLNTFHTRQAIFVCTVLKTWCYVTVRLKVLWWKTVPVHRFCSESKAQLDFNAVIFFISISTFFICFRTHVKFVGIYCHISMKIDDWTSTQQCHLQEKTRNCA